MFTCFHALNVMEIGLYHADKHNKSWPPNEGHNVPTWATCNHIFVWHNELQQPAPELVGNQWLHPDTWNLARCLYTIFVPHCWDIWQSWRNSVPDGIQTLVGGWSSLSDGWWKNCGNNGTSHTYWWRTASSHLHKEQQEDGRLIMRVCLHPIGQNKLIRRSDVSSCHLQTWRWKI